MKSLFKRIALVAGLTALSTVASATICAEYVGTINGLFGGQQLDSQGTNDNAGACQIGGYSFTNFNIVGVVNAGNAPPGQLFAVTVQDDVIPGGLLFGYSNVPGLDFAMTYEVAPGIPGIVLSSFTAIGISELLCEVAGCGTGQAALGHASGGSPTTIVMPGGTFATFVFKDVNGGSDFTQVIIPEPVSVSLVGFGLLGLGLVGRRRRK